MREKTPKLVITFATTSDALAVESAARERGLAGRIIPVPADIDAGCGLAWCVDEVKGDALIAALSALALPHEGPHHVNLY